MERLIIQKISSWNCLNREMKSKKFDPLDPSPKHLGYFCIFTYTFVARNDARKVSHTHFLMSANFDISNTKEG